jgi:hypothetical protein
MLLSKGKIRILVKFKKRAGLPFINNILLIEAQVQKKMIH